MDIETALAILDGEYLCQMERGQRLAPPAMQAPVKSGARHVEFEIPVGEGRQKRCRIVWGSVIGAYDQLEKSRHAGARHRAVRGQSGPG